MKKILKLCGVVIVILVIFHTPVFFDYLADVDVRGSIPDIASRSVHRFGLILAGVFSVLLCQKVARKI